MDALPVTCFTSFDNNPVQMVFAGRVALKKAAAVYYFDKGSIIQKLLHRVKYAQDSDIGLWLGRQMAYQIEDHWAPDDFDLLVPVPISKDRERQRGFNQSQLLCQGLSEVLGIPTDWATALRNPGYSSQTKKNRRQRWEGIKDVFSLSESCDIKDKHILVVDDVITTGATLEAFVRTLMKAKPKTVSVLACCFTSNN